MLLISEIELAEGVDAEAFGDFFRDEYLPSVRTGATRVGQVKGVELLERAADDSRAFSMLVRWSGMSGARGVHVEDEAVQRKLDQLAVVKEPVVWKEVARLTEPDG